MWYVEVPGGKGPNGADYGHVSRTASSKEAAINIATEVYLNRGWNMDETLARVQWLLSHAFIAFLPPEWAEEYEYIPR